MYHAVGYGTLMYLQAAMTFDTVSYVSIISTNYVDCRCLLGSPIERLCKEFYFWCLVKKNFEFRNKMNERKLFKMCYVTFHYPGFGKKCLR